MKKKIAILFLTILLVFVGGCQSKNEDALKFKDEYESRNGTTNSHGFENRTISISEDNPFVYITTEDLLEKIDNKETLYVYFGSSLCPWCRSTVEKAIEVAKKNNVDTIYYVDIWDTEGNEILRDKYVLEDGKAKKTIEGTSDYYKLLEIFDDLLKDYNLTDEDGKTVSVGEKRIFAPNYVYINKGKAKKLVQGISEKQDGAFGELTDEVLEDETNIFEEFFK